ncbi:MBL fold metallo-hydrolase [Tropicimonas omnivorans]|uniref:MBL fold metallo-hydrolase n=1 Tax=Tropicimonas omnivorans TaxID=3075590 RepID=UPI003D77977B
MAPEKAALHGHTHLLSPVEALATLGIDAAAADTVILTHAHYDHLGFLDAFPPRNFTCRPRRCRMSPVPGCKRPGFVAPTRSTRSRNWSPCCMRTG